MNTVSARIFVHPSAMYGSVARRMSLLGYMVKIVTINGKSQVELVKKQSLLSPRPQQIGY